MYGYDAWILTGEHGHKGVPDGYTVQPKQKLRPSRAEAVYATADLTKNSTC